jgi:hypothetical protein
VHSISTSVPNGSWKTATQVLAWETLVVGLNYPWNLTYRLWLPSEELIVCLIHQSKVLHVCDVDVHLDNISQTTAGLFEDSLEILDSLSLKSYGQPSHIARSDCLENLPLCL